MPNNTFRQMIIINGVVCQKLPVSEDISLRYSHLQWFITRLAQSVEGGTFNPKGEGSSPSSGEIRILIPSCNSTTWFLADF